jgi:hypothetical protein
MIINMTTFAGRQKHYIDRTLESLFKSDGREVQVNLIAGSYDTSHIEQYRGVANIVPWDQASQWQVRPGDLRQNCTVNAIRALRYGDDDQCVCCEDDISFEKDWLSQLRLTIAEIERKDYVLNLGQGCDQSPNKRYATHTLPHLIGAQGIFYPSKSLRTAIAEFLLQNMHWGINDNLIGAYAKKYCALYNTTPMLVYHIGQVSSFKKPGPPVRRRADLNPE